VSNNNSLMGPMVAPITSPAQFVGAIGGPQLPTTGASRGSTNEGPMFVSRVKFVMDPLVNSIVVLIVNLFPVVVDTFACSILSVVVGPVLDPHVGSDVAPYMDPRVGPEVIAVVDPRVVSIANPLVGPIEAPVMDPCVGPVMTSFVASGLGPLVARVAGQKGEWWSCWQCSVFRCRRCCLASCKDFF